jgi:hypothetical protein
MLDEELFENLWICPLCLAEHAEPVITCHRCECQMLLLNKIKLTAYYLEKQGYLEMSKRFYEAE